jgi:hypothetical protein
MKNLKLRDIEQILDVLYYWHGFAVGDTEESAKKEQAELERAIRGAYRIKRHLKVARQRGKGKR